MIERGERENLTLKLESALRDFFGIRTNFIFGNYGTGKTGTLDIFLKRTQVIEPLSGLPILGTIRAGLPILAEENIDGYLDVPDYIQADYVLKVVGDSMIGAGIIDGDLAICRKSQFAKSGQIVVAIKDLNTGYSEATLKYYFENAKTKCLRSANPNYQEIYMKDGYRIAGTLVASVRQDAPGYHVYKDYLAVCGREEWTEVIELASQAGMTVGQVREILAAQIEIAKKLKGGY